MSCVGLEIFPLAAYDSWWQDTQDLVNEHEESLEEVLTEDNVQYYLDSLPLRLQPESK